MKVIVTQAFRLTQDDGTVVPYAVGEHDMPEVHATHWYTRLFSQVSSDVKVAEAETSKIAADVKAKGRT